MPNKRDAGGRLIEVDRDLAAQFFDFAREILAARTGAQILWTAEQAQASLGIGESLLRQLVRRRQIPHVRIKGRLLFRPDALRAWATALETGVNNAGAQP